MRSRPASRTARGSGAHLANQPRRLEWLRRL